MTCMPLLQHYCMGVGDGVWGEDMVCLGEEGCWWRLVGLRFHSPRSSLVVDFHSKTLAPIWAVNRMTKVHLSVISLAWCCCQEHKRCWESQFSDSLNIGFVQAWVSVLNMQLSVCLWYALLFCCSTCVKWISSSATYIFTSQQFLHSILHINHISFAVIRIFYHCSWHVHHISCIM